MDGKGAKALGLPGVSKICWKYSEVLSLSGAGASCRRRVTLVVTAMFPGMFILSWLGLSGFHVMLSSGTGRSRYMPISCAVLKRRSITIWSLLLRMKATKYF